MERICSKIETFKYELFYSNIMEETIFTKAIGNTPKIKVLEFLIEGRELDYSISDIAEGAGIGRTTLFRIWDDLIKSNVIKHTRDIGNAKLYKLNITNPFVKKLVDLFDTLVIEPLNKKKIEIMH